MESMDENFLPSAENTRQLITLTVLSFQNEGKNVHPMSKPASQYYEHGWKFSSLGWKYFVIDNSYAIINTNSNEGENFHPMA